MAGRLEDEPRTGLPSPAQPASRFSVPMTFISWARRGSMSNESMRVSVWTTVSIPTERTSLPINE